jgi:hypothetical protein
MATKPQLLVYIRSYFWELYQDMFRGLELYEMTVITDFSGKNVMAINPPFHRHLQAPDPGPTGFNEDEIIRRCRLLRNLPRGQAVRMLRAMHATLVPEMRRQPWVAVMGQTVDDYVTHLLSLIAEQQGIPYIGFCSSYFPDYTQITVGWDGACAVGRVATRAESEAALARVSGDRFRQDYDNMKLYDFRVHAQRVARYWCKRVYFELARRLRGTPQHVHYLLQPFLAQQKRLRDYPRHSFHADWDSRWRNSGRLPVYIPLGYTPECSTDYMILDMRYIDYETTIIRIAERLARDFTVLIKDHFHMQGIRDLAFYDRLREIPGVVLVPPGVNSNALLARGVDHVLSGGGSVGVEATIRGKKLYAFSDTIYWQPPSGSRFLKLDELEDWPEQIRSFQPAPSDPVGFVQTCLGYMLPFDFMKLAAQPGAKARPMELFVKDFLASRRSSSTPV